MHQISHNAPFSDRNVHTCVGYRTGALWDLCDRFCVRTLLLVFQLFRKTDDIYERRMTIYHMSHSWQVHVITLWQPLQVANMLKRKCFKMTTPSAASDANFVQMTFSFQNGNHSAENIFRCIFMNQKICIFIKISLKFVPKVPIDNNRALVQIMAWRRPGDKPLSEPMLTRFTDAYMRH